MHKIHHSRAAGVTYRLDDTNAGAARLRPALLRLRTKAAVADKRVARSAVMAALLCLLAAGGLMAQQPTKVLFMCPHGAAKSVLASAYFQRVARERGLNVRVESAGTDPQDAVSPLVAKHLTAKGYPVPVARPRAVTPQDLQSADLVISLGCDISRLAVRPGTLRQWDDVPGPSEDLEGADAAIERRVLALVEELLARRK